MVLMPLATMDAAVFRSSVPQIVQYLAQHPAHLQHVIPFFFKTREYRKLHEILKAVIKAGQVIDDTCLRLYGSSVSDLTIATVCETWSWFLGFKLTAALLNLFCTFLKHISISQDSLVASSRADFADRLKQTEDLIDSQLQKDDRIQWLKVCHIIGHIKLLYMFHGPETMIQLTKKVKWHDMSFVFGMAFDWKSLFTESLSSDGPEKETAIQLLGLKLRFCDVMYAFSESKQLLDSRQQLVHQLLIQPDIGSYLLRDSLVDLMLQSTSRQQDVQLLAQAVVKQFPRKGNNHAQVNEAALSSSPAFQTAVVGSTIAELLQVAKQGNDLHPILSLLCDANTGWIEFQYSVPRENNKCWHAIREASQMLIQSKQSAENLFTVSSSRIGLILNGLRNFVFFQTLLPLNQSRCMIVYLMLLLRWSKDKMRESLIDALITMLAGLRSIWLFDFVPPSFVLLNLPNEAPQVDTLVPIIMSRVLKYENLLNDFNDKIVKQKGLGEVSRLHGDLLQAYTEEQSKANSHLCRGEIVNEVVEAAISKVLKGLRKSEAEDSERFVKSAEHLHRLSLLLRLDPENRNRKIVALVKKVLRNIFSSDEILNNDEAKFLEAVCERRQKLDAILSEEFMSELCNKVLGRRHEASSSSSATDVREIIFREAKRFKSDSAVKSVFHANLIRSMLESCNETECTSLYEDLRSRFRETRDPDNCVVLIRCLEVWANHRTGGSASEAEHRDAHAAAELMFDLTNRLRNGVGEGVNVDLVVSTLNLTHALIRTHSAGKWLSVNAALNVTAFALHEIRKQGPATADCVTEFARILLAVQAVLFQAIVCQKIAVITVMPYFNILSSRLFRMCLSLCDEELLNTCCSEAKTAAEKCAQSVSTLITSLCNLCDFHPFAAQLVAVYVDWVHSHIVHHHIKPILLSCVYRLLRVIGSKHSNTLERQHVRLHQAGKDLLKQLLANYEQFYRYRGHV